MFERVIKLKEENERLKKELEVLKMVKEKEEPKEEKPAEIKPTGKEDVMIVKELPQQDIRVFIDEEGTKVKLIKEEEALTEMYKDIKHIKKTLGK